VLLVDRDPSAAAIVRSILRAQEWEVIICKTAADALAKARVESPDAIILELNLADMDGVELCKALRERSETADTPILVLSSSAGVTERVACLRAGATDYLVKPPDAQDLIARLRAALDLRKEKAGFVIAVVGSKGGVGASVSAVNLAIALRAQTHRRVVLVDAAMPSGTIDVMLNLQPTARVGQLLPRLDQLERADFEAILNRHATGIEVFLLNDLGAEGTTPEEARRMLLALRRMRDVLVVDTRAARDDTTAAILDVADRVLLILTPEITSLRGARLFVEWSRQIGLSRERVIPVLNRTPLPGGLQRRDIASALGAPIQGTMPDEVKLVTYSINRGVPVVTSHQRSSLARQFTALARDVAKAIQEK
jgi:pilus assembly protein CpaE